MRVFHLPIEEYENRYTADFRRWFSNAFGAAGVKEVLVLGKTLAKEITNGKVLDAVGTNYYKATQLERLMEYFQAGEIKPGDKVFIADVWFPGVEMIPYVAKLLHLEPIELHGIIHAGTYDAHDFTRQAGMEYFGQYSERAWLAVFDKVYVGSQFHVDLIRQYRDVPGLSEKLVLTGLPLPIPELLERGKYTGWRNKKDLVVFPHRFDKEKQPEKFYELAEKVCANCNAEFKVLSPRVLGEAELQEFNQFANKPGVRLSLVTGLTRNEYFQELAKAKVVFSAALQETFGYAVAEAVALGAYPVVPDRLSYKTMYSPEYQYTTMEEAVEKTLTFLGRPEPCPVGEVLRYDDAALRIVRMIARGVA